MAVEVVVIVVLVPVPLPLVPPPLVPPPEDVDEPALTLLLQPMVLRAAIDRKIPSNDANRRRRGRPRNNRLARATPPPAANRCIWIDGAVGGVWAA